MVQVFLKTCFDGREPYTPRKIQIASLDPALLVSEDDDEFAALLLILRRSRASLKFFGIYTPFFAGIKK